MDLTTLASIDDRQPQMNESLKISIAAKELRISPKRLYKLIQEGRIKAKECEIGGEVYIERAELERFKAARIKETR